MKTISRILNERPAFRQVYDELHKKNAVVAVSGCFEGSKLHVASALCEGFSNVLFITYSETRLKEIKDEYRLYDRDVYIYPPKDLMFYQADIRGNELYRERMRALRRRLEGERLTMVTTVDALMAHMCPLRVFEENTLSMAVNEGVNPSELARRLVMLGYSKNYQVESPGEFSIRGDIIDIFEITEDNPYRIELWGDDIESIRSFDVLSQRSIEELSRIKIYPATDIILSDTELSIGIDRIEREATAISQKYRGEFKTEEAHRIESNFKTLKEEALIFRNTTNLDSYIDYFYEEPTSPLDIFKSDDTVVFIDEPMRIEELSSSIEAEFRDNMERRLLKGYVLPGQTGMLFGIEEILQKIGSTHVAYLEGLRMNDSLKGNLLKPTAQIELGTQKIQSYNGSFDTLVKDLAKFKKDGYRVLLLSGSKTRAQRLSHDLMEHDLLAFYSENEDRILQPKEIQTAFGYVSKGFQYPEYKLAIISETDIFGAQRGNKKRRKRYNGQQIRDFNELTVGDYVVHEYYGLGIYRGIEQMTIDDVTKDYLKIEYADKGELYILATALGVLQKYASSDSKAPRLNKLGSADWTKTKEKVRRATEEVARDLVELYAKRQQVSGYQYGADTIWQKEFEELFPFEETPDQLSAIEDTKADMESTKIMDRLICGDVGFGKTEVAIRAAFKAVQEGKQVVFLVPTTILAQQHYDTVKERMKDYPISISLLSRFKTAAEIKQTLKDLKSGMVDIVIGTHRVLSKDVEFKDLGLLIIDEEQRFGVAHKERIKKLKESVDVLTLTATPIPRTLHMSLIGIRDMSVLEEAPNDRLPIQTYVMEYNEEMVREAIVRELSRQGQVYYVYNRVNNIDRIAAELSELVPEARIAYAHGQMAEKELEYVMYQFVNHEIDVLVSTTIIETGMDISNVNTMIIHDSDRLGLSQLYQLRGRVGRSNRTAYAFLMYRRDRYLKEEAQKRLSAIKEFTDLGSGYKIAMKDLEIRGAGNLLGKSQHGHMQAVGYDLYCKMLNEAVMELKGLEVSEDFETLIDIGVDAFIPPEYIVNETQKLDIYKRIAGLETDEECKDMENELLDRFGTIPLSALNLIRISMLRVKAHALYITEIKDSQDAITLAVRKDAPLDPNGVVNLFKSFPMLSFSNKTYRFIYSNQKTGLAQKDERILLELLENLLEQMNKELLKE